LLMVCQLTASSTRVSVPSDVLSACFDLKNPRLRASARSRYRHQYCGRSDHGDRREVLLRIVGQLCIDARVDDVAGRNEQQRITIRRGLGGGDYRSRPAGPDFMASTPGGIVRPSALAGHQRARSRSDPVQAPLNALGRVIPFTAPGVVLSVVGGLYERVASRHVDCVSAKAAR
jgi:hypothetical protein